MIIGLDRSNKKKGFTLVELMLLLVVVSLVIASSYSLITRKHRLIPRKSLHGQYACFKDFTPIDNPEDPGHTITNWNHEILISGNTVIKDGWTRTCQFMFPKAASYVYMQMVGGGGAGGNANYNVLPQYNTYNHRLYYRAINLVEPDWNWRETYKHSSGSSSEQRFYPKRMAYRDIATNNVATANANDGLNLATGHNYINTIESWGGTTSVLPDGNNGVYYDTAYPKVKYTQEKCTVNSSQACADEVTDQSEALSQYSNSLGDRVNNPRRGISRDYVNKHFVFHAKERQVTPDVEKGRYVEVPLNNEKNSLFDSNLFQYIVRNHVVYRMFSYDKGGEGPTAPGYMAIPLMNEFSCSGLGANSVALTNFADCLSRAFNSGKLGKLAKPANGGTAGFNEWCVIPHAKFAKALADGVQVGYQNKPAYTLTAAEANEIKEHEEYYASYCPVIYNYYGRNKAEATLCGGGVGGEGSWFTSITREYAFNFFPVLGVRWKREDFTGNPDTCEEGSTNSSRNFYCYYYFKKKGAPGGEGALHADIYDPDLIDLAGYSDLNARTVQALEWLSFKGRDDVDDYKYEPNTSKYPEPDHVPEAGLNGTLVPCPMGSNGTNACIIINGVEYQKAKDGSGNLVNAPEMSPKPNLQHSIKFTHFGGDPEWFNWNYFSGGYPHGFPNTLGFEIGVGQISEKDDYYMGESGETTYDRSVETNPIATACLTRGIMVFSNKHQRNNSLTQYNYEGKAFNPEYLPQPFKLTKPSHGGGIFGGGLTVQHTPDVNICRYQEYEADEYCGCTQTQFENGSCTKAVDWQLDSNNYSVKRSRLQSYLRNTQRHIPSFIWLDDLTQTSNSVSTATAANGFGGTPNFRQNKLDPWMGCVNYTTDGVTIDNTNCMSSIEQFTDNKLGYVDEAFGMTPCGQDMQTGSISNCAATMFNNKRFNLGYCGYPPLKVLYVNGPQTQENAGKAIIPVVSDFRNAVIPKAFGTPGRHAVGPADFVDKTVQINGEDVLIKYGLFYPDGTFFSCPTRQNDKGSAGNTGFDFVTYEGRIVFVGRTGLLLRDDYLLPDGTYKKYSAIGKGNNWVRDTALDTPPDATQPNNKVSLSNTEWLSRGEEKVGLYIYFNYYTHALMYGTPGKSGEYKTIFARAFSDSPVLIEAGNGGARRDIMPGGDVYAPNAGEPTIVKYNCDLSGQTECDVNCKCEYALGGQGGSHAQRDYLEWGNLHQDQTFIKNALDKLRSIKNAAGSDGRGMKDNGGVDSGNPNTFNIFPHCSLWAPKPTPGNIEKYKYNGKTLIDSTCYGNGGVEAEESNFAGHANLFDMSQVESNVDITRIGKGGDGGFVRDDCWIVPQYFELRGLFMDRSAFPPVYQSGSGGHKGNTGMAHDLHSLSGSGNGAATGDNWGVVPNFEGDTIYNALDGAKLSGPGSEDEKAKMKLAGYTNISPYLIYDVGDAGKGACRRQRNRYTGDYTYKHSGQNGQTHYKTFPNGEKVGIRAYGGGNATNGTNYSQFATEIQASEGQPGGVFITW